MAARRRSFHLSAGATITAPLPATLNPQRIEAGALSIGLLAFAHQASAFVFTLLGGCAPGMRPKTKRVPRALLAGSPRAEVKAVAEASDGGQQIQLPTPSNEDRQPDWDDIAKTVEPQSEVHQALTDVREVENLEGVLLVGEPQTQTLNNDVTSSVPEAPNYAAPADSLLVTNPPTTLTEKTALYIRTRAKAAPAIISPPGSSTGHHPGANSVSLSPLSFYVKCTRSGFKLEPDPRGLLSLI
ncbi:hypothetical protein B0H19DRAFT_1380931 [Mycena capillaripes]|nr:hypothetical protein B0H19DRAFT_1380931 [Mycena capillaripes]